MKNSLNRTRRLALSALLLALTLVIARFEQMLPVLPFMPPGVKLGLSNIVVMFTLFVLGYGYALPLALLKSLFVLLTRGTVAGLLSAAGGLLSITVMFAAEKLHASYLLTAVIGAVFHNLGQLIVVSLWLGVRFFSVYLPLLILSGAVAGVITGLIFAALMPALIKIPWILPGNTQGDSENE